MATQRTLAALTLLAALAYGLEDPCAPSCSQGDVLYPHPRSCVNFYQCAHGVPYLQSCPGGLNFSPTLLLCDYPSAALCTSHSDAICGVSEPTTGPKTTGAHPTPTAAPTPPVSDCVPPCPSPSALYPHPHDCSSYFHCAYSVPYLKRCPPGQEYSGPLVRCDYPSIAQCSASPSNPCVAVTNPPTPSPVPQPTPSPAPHCAPACPWPDAYMPHPQDCTKFYICGGMVAFESKCQTGLHYDMNLVRCDYPELANCVAHRDRACDELLRP